MEACKQVLPAWRLTKLIKQLLEKRHYWDTKCVSAFCEDNQADLGTGGSDASVQLCLVVYRNTQNA